MELGIEMPVFSHGKGRKMGKFGGNEKNGKIKLD